MLSRRMMLVFVAVAGLAGFAKAGDLKTPAVISDNMVVQANKEVPIWGKAKPGAQVNVGWSHTKDSQATQAGKDGRWMVKLPAMKAGGPWTMVIRSGEESLEIKNVLVGEVWLCSGQSNMHMPPHPKPGYPGVPDYKTEIATANYPSIRLFTVQSPNSLTPQDDCDGKWVVCTPKSVTWFSAVAYFFGRSLHLNLDKPVGLIHASWGGTPITAWTSKQALEAEPAAKPLLEQWKKMLVSWEKTGKQQYAKDLANWEEAVKKAKAEGKKPPRRTTYAYYTPNSARRPSVLFNARIHPLIPYAIRGVIWYQGEHNGGMGWQYRKLLPCLINDWRKQWKQGDFTFLIVQLTGFRKIPEQPGPGHWAELREAQAMALSLPNTGMAVTIDAGDVREIHAPQKQIVSHRLALAARKLAYGQDVEHLGPMYKTMTIEGNKIRLKFANAAGLEARGAKPEPIGFAIAGADKKFVWANAKIEGDSVVVWNDAIAKPAAVRYAWSMNSAANLYNKAGLPANPFRTDDWPLASEKKYFIDCKY